MGNATIRLENFTELDKIQLTKDFGPGSVRFEKSSPTGDDHGELTTLAAIVIVSLSALKVLAVHLARKSAGQDLSVTTEITTPDGKVRKTTIKISSKSSEPPSAQAIKQLGAACNVDVSSLLKG